MSWTIKIEGNFFVIFDTASPFSEVFRSSRAQTSFIYYQESAVDYFEFSTSVGKWIKGETVYDFTDLIDNRTGAAFSDVNELIEFLSLNLGIELQNIYSGLSSKFIFISKLGDFSEPIAGVIQLLANVTYFITTDLDLEGNRLVSNSDTTIIGGSSENCTLTSTGLGAGVPLLTIEYTTPIRHISFENVDTAIAVDGTARLVALDWTGVNFVDVPNIGTINNCDNFIFTKGAFLNSDGMAFTGTIGTVAFNQSLFNGQAGGTLFDLQAGLTITRRFRIIYSSLISLSGETSISLNVAATVPNNGIILDTCNFAGGGTYLSGIDYLDNKALFVNNDGIINSREIAQYYMNGNATATTIAATGTAVKVAGTTTNGALTSKFTHTDNRATYIGSIDRIFKVTATLSVESGNNNVIGIYVAKNGTLIADSEIYITTNAGGRAEGAAVQALTTLTDTDYLEIWVENDTAIADVTVTDLNVIIQ